MKFIHVFTALIATFVATNNTQAFAKNLVDGAFGIELGKSYEINIDPVDLDESLEYQVNPTEKSPHFSKYFIKTNPISRKVHNIIGLSPYMNTIQECIEKAQGVFSLLKEKYSHLQTKSFEGFAFYKGLYDNSSKPEKGNFVELSCESDLSKYYTPPPKSGMMYYADEDFEKSMCYHTTQAIALNMGNYIRKYAGRSFAPFPAPWPPGLEICAKDRAPSITLQIRYGSNKMWELSLKEYSQRKVNKLPKKDRDKGL
jgi:hypothetical protein